MSYMQKDYILRMIEQFIEVLTSIIKSRSSGNPGKALEQICAASQFYLNSDISVFLHYTPDQLLAHFKVGSNQFDAESALICAELLFELAMITEGQTDEQEAFRPKALHLKKMALELYLKALSTDPEIPRADYLKKIANLKDELSASAISTKNCE